MPETERPRGPVGLIVIALRGEPTGDIAEAKPKLPEATRYVVVEGGVHAFFGDYGNQPGDGAPGVTRAAAQAQIVKTTQAFLVSITPRAKKR